MKSRSLIVAVLFAAMSMPLVAAPEESESPGIPLSVPGHTVSLSKDGAFTILGQNGVRVEGKIASQPAYLPLSVPGHTVSLSKDGAFTILGQNGVRIEGKINPELIKRPDFELDRSKPKGVMAAFLGVNTEPLDHEATTILGLNGTGLKVAFVAPDSPAATAGLAKGDVLTKLGDQILVNAEQFAVLIRTHQGGDTVTLHALRDGKPIEIKAELAQRVLPQLGPGGRHLDRAWRVQQQRPVNPFNLVGPGQPSHLEWEIIPQLDEQMPEELREIMRKMQEQMQQQQEQIEQRMQQMRLELDLDLDELREQLKPQPGEIDGEHRVQASIMIADGEHTLQLKINGDAKHLTVKTADGETLFEGDVPEDGKIEGLDPKVQQKIDNLLNNKIKAGTIDVG